MGAGGATGEKTHGHEQEQNEFGSRQNPTYLNRMSKQEIACVCGMGG